MLKQLRLTITESYNGPGVRIKACLGAEVSDLLSFKKQIWTEAGTRTIKE